MLLNLFANSFLLNHVLEVPESIHQGLFYLVPYLRQTDTRLTRARLTPLSFAGMPRKSSSFAEFSHFDIDSKSLSTKDELQIGIVLGRKNR